MSQREMTRRDWRKQIEADKNAKEPKTKPSPKNAPSNKQVQTYQTS